VSISSTFFEQLLRQYFCAKKLPSQNITREKMHNLLLYKKFVHKMLMKLRPGEGGGVVGHLTLPSSSTFV